MASFVHDWLIREQSECNSRIPCREHVLFLCALSYVTALNKYICASMPSDKYRDIGFDGGEYYMNDVVIFEVLCFLWSYTDYIIFANDNKSRSAIADHFGTMALRLFPVVGDEEYVASLIDNRLNGYARLIRDGHELKVMLDYLVELVTRAKNAARPTHYLFNSDEPITLSLESAIIKTSVYMWANAVLSKYDAEMEIVLA